MKFSFTVEIGRPVDKIIELFDNPDVFWMGIHNGLVVLIVAGLCLLPAVGAMAQTPECSDTLPSHDYSSVGYREGDVPVPYLQRPATVNFGPGRHIIDNMILLSDGDVLRGAGRDETILYFPNGLKDLGEPCGHEGVDCYDWKNGVIRAEGKEIGIEDLTVEFPAHEWCHYCGPDNGGFNAVSLRDCTDCWVKNVTIRNADSGLFIEGGSNNTVYGLHVYVQPDHRAHLHIAISGRANNNLVTHFKVFGKSFHGLTCNWGSRSNVFANGWGENIRIEPDHNCNGPGGAASCCTDIMYSNISGVIESIQTHDRAKNPLQTILWNVGNTTLCPKDAYQAQLEQRNGIDRK